MDATSCIREMEVPTPSRPGRITIRATARAATANRASRTTGDVQPADRPGDFVVGGALGDPWLTMLTASPESVVRVVPAAATPGRRSPAAGRRSHPRWHRTD